jgi:hypothetical protein
MMRFPRRALATVAALAAGTIASVASADAAPVTNPATTPTPSAVVKVDHDSPNNGWDRRHYRRYHHRHYHRDGIVDAPFTRVETGRRVIVDAPFAHVYSGRHGHHVVAPFVDLWVPR